MPGVTFFPFVKPERWKEKKKKKDHCKITKIKLAVKPQVMLQMMTYISI